MSENVFLQVNLAASRAHVGPFFRDPTAVRLPPFLPHREPFGSIWVSNHLVMCLEEEKTGPLSFISSHLFILCSFFPWKVDFKGVQVIISEGEAGAKCLHSVNWFPDTQESEKVWNRGTERRRMGPFLQVRETLKWVE